MAKLSKKKQEELIDIEVKRLESIMSSISEEKRELAKGLIQRISFMTITLEILEDSIKTKGPTYLFKNGSQQMIVENPAQKSYNAMINRYTTAFDKLMSLLPKKNEGEDGDGEDSDGFDEFVNERDADG
ncbi:hypothetical protein SAMN02787081_01971 [Lysinibacillus fusiformis]|uniref:P27 family phage terminase small subunit n=2 Tax=Lysinibacillus fusiformis TaxID=28031 RepID=A0A1H9HCI6_9BACI|nr:hypothetical protein SAMN02787081_01971 [Lysinibacillus fusiformis]SEN53003.1 hypothetical protein SAMN02787103_02050 [Lysinibacillus fusiformis]SEQ59966.1 hypothetical protein SAMN02787113_01984 [Lysinibacillus fusiformis]